ncbi:hypothetical protein [Anaerocolumna chitinilytica]|uniref:Uncharacterized protein n=1 Tax=Anaerocolumna chitinilytica TaxID=1727145 RepID=A0A7M3SA79_9FIRM|nr:hypothetical protein [Anaerocolumna chitinilytica]BCK01497.1 hypothetical protein bsdcttw_45370 [Anaerocolumna chitinilytica]
MPPPIVHIFSYVITRFKEGRYLLCREKYGWTGVGNGTFFAGIMYTLDYPLP